MTEARTQPNQLDDHAARRHDGFAHEDPAFEAERTRRAELIRRFIAVMDEAGRPGLARKFGSTVLQLTGQRPEHYWETKLSDGAGHQRAVLVFDDGTHGWSDEITYSDRPRTPTDEISAHNVETALTQILHANDLSWPDQPHEG